VGAALLPISSIIVFASERDFMAGIGLIVGMLAGGLIGIGLAFTVGEPAPVPKYAKHRIRPKGMPCVQCGERHTDIADCRGVRS
jgi:hypothetical protein